MGVPKRRSSKRRIRLRRPGQAPVLPRVVECPQCHQPRLPHRACPHCGYYKGAAVAEIKERKK